MKKNLIIGYGNTTRSDDGAGPYTAHLIEKENLPETEVWVMQQLHVDLAEDLLSFERIYFIDASEKAEKTELEKVPAKNIAAVHSSHHLGPSVLASLCRMLYDICPEFYCCQIPAKNMDFGENLSAVTEQGAKDAVSLILKSIKETNYA